MRILITGSSGEIGTNLALRLLKEGHEVFGVDRRPNTWTDKFPYILQDLSERFVNFKGGIGDQKYPENLDAVVHLAANAKVHELVSEPWRALDNIIVTFNALEFCRENRLPIIFASSREVYGDAHRYIDQNGLAAGKASTHEAQTHISFTESTYSASKISGEALVYSYAKCYGLPYVVFRFSNVYGRYDNDIERMERVLPLFIRKIADGEPITVFGREKTLDFTYVDDCVEGIVLGIKKLVAGDVKNETINLAYGQGHSLLEAVDYISSALGKKPEMSISPPHVGEVTYYVADISKARKLLGYEPKVPLKEGIAKAIEWAKEWDASAANHESRITNSEFRTKDNKGTSGSERKKILIFSAFFPPFRGGAEVFVEEVGKRLAKKHDVTVITAMLDGKLPASETVDGMHIIRIGLGIKWDKYIYPFIAPLRALYVRNDIAYGVLESYAGVALAFYKLFTRKPSILNLQSGTLDDWRRGHGLNLLVRRFVHRMPDAIHAISRHLASRAKWLGAKNVAVIPNGIDIRKFVVSALKDPNKIICVGRLYPVKGQAVLMRAIPHVLKEFPFAAFYFVGDGPDREALKKLADDLGISSRVVFAGAMPHDALPKEIASAAIAVGPSIREGQGIAFVEMQAAGTAVVGTNVGGIPEIIEDGVTGLLVPPENPQALAQAILKLLRDPIYAKHLAEQAKKQVPRYDWDRIAGEVEGLIMENTSKA
jgi:nucleoside-diphosphate-sugar epimerase/glycosyltransferase involved in cell wall biosynthesis